MSTALFVFDPFATGFAVDPYPHYARLQAETEHPLGFWILSRHADVAALQRSSHSVDESNIMVQQRQHTVGEMIPGGFAVGHTEQHHLSGEGRIAFSAFVRRFPDACLEKVRWNSRTNVRGPTELIVTV
ncbi:hypothetical protein [Nocardia sp. NPDC004123]